MSKFVFSKTSLENKETCTKKIQIALEKALNHGVLDFKVLYGHRPPDVQFDLFKKGRSKIGKISEIGLFDDDILRSKNVIILKNSGVKGVDGIWKVFDYKSIVTNKDGYVNLSKHNFFPSKAVDVVPVINGRISFVKEHVLTLSGFLMSFFQNEMKDKWRWGGNWDRDQEVVTDQIFNDLLHFEEYF